MTKTATTKSEREARRAARLAEKEAKAKALQAEIDRAGTCLAAPPDLSTWGVVKTRCWLYLHDKLRKHLAVKRPCQNRLRELNDAISGVGEWTAERCHKTVIKKTL